MSKYELMLIWEGNIGDYASAPRYRIVAGIDRTTIIEVASTDALGSPIWVALESVNNREKIFAKAFVELASRIKKLEEANNAKFSIEPKPLLD